MSSSTGPTFLPWTIIVLFIVSIALFVMASWHFQQVINTQKEQIMELSERLTSLEEKQNGESTAKSSFSKENGMAKRQIPTSFPFPTTWSPWSTPYTITPSCICPVGLRGPPGSKGARGIQGPKGDRGYTGSRGLQGYRGYTGNPGPKGSHGYPGSSGHPGSNGIPGADGSPGPVGPEGIKGQRGTRGPKGVNGVKGDVGSPGVNGKVGPRGRRGQRGEKGKQGASGSAGIDGPPGMAGPRGLQGSAADVGTTYIRWGHHACPSSADIVYSGKIAGANRNEKGGGSSTQCLPTDPEYTGSATSTAQKKAYIYGAQYDNNAFTSNHDIPCVLCYANRSTTQMIPAKFTCPSGWTNEYHGYLMTSLGYQSKVEYMCVDKASRSTNRRSKIDQGLLLYPVEVKCQSLPCPPYNATMDLMCVLCTK